MMYPRLRLAKNLLTEDGVIFISIDDNEVENLKKMCNEIFGEDNFIANFIWQKMYAPKNNNKYVSTDHEHILCFAKSIINIKRFNRLDRDEDANSMYKYDDNDGRGRYRLSDLTMGNKKGYDINWGGRCYPEPKNSGWRYNEPKMYELIKDNRIYLPEDESKRPAYKRYLKDVEGIITRTILPHMDVGHTDSSKKALNDLIGDNIFDYPKPVDLIIHFLTISSNSNDIILDFFSGSATSAHAVMKINNEKNTNRKFIMVQVPECTDEKSEAYKSGYKNICEIGKERIRRAGDKIVEESDNKDLDIGFKVFKLDSSNLDKWDPDYNDLEQTLLTSKDNVKSDRTQEDLIYEIMLKYGVDLSLPIEKHEMCDNTIYSIGFGALLICLDDNITKEITNGIIELCSEVTRVVFKDNGFKSDSEKTNIKEILKTNYIEEFITI